MNKQYSKIRKERKLKINFLNPYCWYNIWCAVHWHRLFTSHLQQSGQLLQYLDTHWARFKAVDTPEFQDTVQAFQDYLVTATGKEDLGLCRDGCAAVLARVSR